MNPGDFKRETCRFYLRGPIVKCVTIQSASLRTWGGAVLNMTPTNTTHATNMTPTNMTPTTMTPTT